MPSQVIIPSSLKVIQTRFTSQIPKRWSHQFQFGVRAFTLKPFVSLASNARQTVGNPDTASTKVDRLTRNHGLAEAIAQMTAGLGIVTPTSLVNCDHSDFKGLMAFVGAVQTGKGRAVPVMVGTSYSPRLPAHDRAPKRKQAMRRAYKLEQENLYRQAEHELQAFHDRLGFWPKLVFDRGFGGLKLVRFMTRNQAIFYVRLKASRYVEYDGQRIQVSGVNSRDTMISLGGLKLRLVRSAKPKKGEPWYILTSDFDSSRKQILRVYYHRFEIEETFKDVKHILDLEQAKLTKPLTLKVLLWFVSLSFILAWLVHFKTEWRKRHPKKQLSWYRVFFEAWQWELGQALYWELQGGSAK